MNPFVKQVAIELIWLQPDPVFIGGSVLGYYLDAFGRSQLRTTLDVDIIVPAISTYPLWSKLEAQLRSKGWNPHQDGPICRYRSPSGILVDFLPNQPEILGFAGKWYSDICLHPSVIMIDEISIHLAQPAHFLSTKLEAFFDRGMQDPIMSHDLEDIVSLIDGCHALFDSLQRQKAEIRDWIQKKMAFIASQEWFFDSVMGNLPRGPNQQKRVQMFLKKWQTMTQS